MKRPSRRRRARRTQFAVLGALSPGFRDARRREPAIGFVSVGYEGRTGAELVDVLRRHRVSLLVDVRLNAVSRRPGFSRRALAGAMHDAGIEYRHARELGNPPDNRAALRAGDPEARRRFLAHLARRQAVLADVTAEANRRVVALLCVERSHDSCHRSCITSAALEQSPGLPLIIA